MKQNNLLEQEIGYRQVFWKTIESLNAIADSVCNETIEFRPDLLVVLAHGGLGPLWASQRMWFERNHSQLPPVLVTNIGLEKMDRYEKARSRLPFVDVYPFTADHARIIECGYFLAWITQQTDWMDNLRRQIFDALNQPPERILILDDASFTGETYRLVLGLLNAIFPDCQTRMIAGSYFEWRSEIATPWLLRHGVSAEMILDLGLALYRLVPGTEDCDGRDSFDWKPITVDSPIIKSLSRILPAETWMELPGWSKTAIQDGISKLHMNNKKRAVMDDEIISRPTLEPLEVILKQVWINGRVEPSEISTTLKTTIEVTKGYLSRLVNQGELHFERTKKNDQYSLPDGFENLMQPDNFC